MSDKNVENNVSDTERQEMEKMNEEDFAAMLEQSSPGKRLHPGQKVKAKVVSVSGDFVYIDLGGKSEGAIDISEFLNKEGGFCVREGDEIEAFFVTVQDGIMKLTTLVGGYSAVTLKGIRDSYEAGIPVNGEVKREIKGGFEVSVGGVKCFCPFSQINLKARKEGAGYTGKTFPFKVLEYSESGIKIVLSRRALLEQEQEEKVKKLKESLAVGGEITAEVKSLQKFGAFVDLGGVEGLIPASEISWDRNKSPDEVLSVGQNINAKIVSLDWDKNRITMSLKALQPDPWASAAEKYPVDSRVSGTISRLSPFGAFVRLEPGIDGLIHISNLGAGRRIKHPREVVEEGQWVDVYVLSVDPENRKIALSMQPKVEPVKIVLPSPGEILEGVVEKVMPFGVFLKTANGISGLIQNTEMGTPPGTDHRHMFPPGTEMQAVVLEADTSNKVRLSRKAVLEKAVQDEFTQYQQSVKNLHESSGRLGSLGEILKAKLQEKESRG